MYPAARRHASCQREGRGAVKERLDDSSDYVVAFHRSNIHGALNGGKNDCGDDADDNCASERANDFGRRHIFGRRIFSYLHGYPPADAQTRTVNCAHDQSEEQALARRQSQYNTDNYASDGR